MNIKADGTRTTTETVGTTTTGTNPTAGTNLAVHPPGRRIKTETTSGNNVAAPTTDGTIAEINTDQGLTRKA